MASVSRQRKTMLSCEIRSGAPLPSDTNQKKPPRTGPYEEGRGNVYSFHDVVSITGPIVPARNVSLNASVAPPMPPAENVRASPPTAPLAQTLTTVAPAGTGYPGFVPQLPTGYCQ